MNKNETILFESLNKPLLKDRTLSIDVKRYYTDVNGAIIDKSAAPAAMQIDYPVYLLGEFDRQGGYFYGNRSKPPLPGVEYWGTLVWGIGYTFPWPVNPLSEIQEKLGIGDIVTIYADNIIAPTNYVFIVQSANVRSLASIMANTKTSQIDNKVGELNIKQIQYFSNNEDQWGQDIEVLWTNNLGDVNSNVIEPFLFKTPHQIAAGFVEISKWKFAINQYIGLNTYLLFATDRMFFNFKLGVK